MKFLDFRGQHVTPCASVNTRHPTETMLCFAYTFRNITEECIYHRGKHFSRVSNLPEILPVLANHISDVSQPLIRALKSHIGRKDASRFYNRNYVSKTLFGVASLWLMWFCFNYRFYLHNLQTVLRASATLWSVE